MFLNYIDWQKHHSNYNMLYSPNRCANSAKHLETKIFSFKFLPHLWAHSEQAAQLLGNIGLLTMNEKGGRWKKQQWNFSNKAYLNHIRRMSNCTKVSSCRGNSNVCYGNWLSCLFSTELFARTLKSHEGKKSRSEKNGSFYVGRGQCESLLETFTSPWDITWKHSFCQKLCSETLPSKSR